MLIGRLHCHLQADCRFPRPNSPRPPVGTADADGLLMFPAHPELRRGEQTVDDVIILPDTIIDELAIAFGADHKQWWRFSLRNTAGHFDINLGTVIERGNQPPRRV